MAGNGKSPPKNKASATKKAPVSKMGYMGKPASNWKPPKGKR